MAVRARNAVWRYAIDRANDVVTEAVLNANAPNDTEVVPTQFLAAAVHYTVSHRKPCVARTRMIAAQNASAESHKYCKGDLVKVSTRMLPLRDDTLSRKLQPQWVGPLPVVEEVNPGAIRIELPETYKLVHDVFSVHDIRPWLSHESHVLAPTYPTVQPHPAFNPIVQVVDRRSANSRLPRHMSPIDIPAVYKVLRASGAAEWLRTDAFVTTAEQDLVLSFEERYPRSDAFPATL